ncbi:MAG: prepilin-type N-terminal cleavage/methylation domain-containing protein [Candidatus Falkowbacteria bacterium]
MISNFTGKPTGFSLLELLLVMAVLMILAVAGRQLFLSYTASGAVDDVAQELKSEITIAHNKAIAGAYGVNWGIRAVQPDSGQSYYQLFYSPGDFAHPSTTIVNQVYLPIQISFSNPLSGTEKEINFTAYGGTTTATNVIFVAAGTSRQVTVATSGVIEIL